MAYASSTEGSSAKIPTLDHQSIAGGRSWTYVSTHDVNAAGSTGFFTDGQTLGMVLNDRVLISDASCSNESSGHWWTTRVNVVTSTGVGVSTGELFST